jgi:hypothetical protein
MLAVKKGEKESRKRLYLRFNKERRWIIRVANEFLRISEK